jgi:hypothetical protein
MSVYGFRRWRVGQEGELLPLTIRGAAAWSPGIQPPAECLCHRGFPYDLCNGAPGTVHRYPAMGSRCGYYLHRSPILPCFCPQAESGILHGAVGVVRGWGRHVEHTDGWRVQHAEIVALVDLSGNLSSAYNTAARYPDMRTMYAEWAPGATTWATDEVDWCQHLGPTSGMRYGSSEFEWHPTTWTFIAGTSIPREGSWEAMRATAAYLRLSLCESFAQATQQYVNQQFSH